MNRISIRFLSFACCASLCLSLISLPSLSYADSNSETSQNSALTLSGINLFSSEGDVWVTQTREVTISMEKETSGVKLDSEDEGDEGVNSDSFEAMDDPFADETPEYPPIEDPYEGYNRFMFNVNDTFYTYLLRPVAAGYKIVVPEGVRLSVKNLFQNVRSPVHILSSIIQGDMDKTRRVLGRFIINTTIGIGGLFDVAKTHFDIQPVNEDFDQALGYHGVSTGPYIVLPLLGPSSGRNAVGTLVDQMLNPTTFVSPSFAVGTGINVGNITNEISFNVDAYDDLKDSAVDPYVSLRDFNHQFREGLVDK